jgi:hypothetical protein
VKPETLGTRVRNAVRNPDRTRITGMSARVERATGSTEPVVPVPDDAVSDTGTRRVMAIMAGRRLGEDAARRAAPMISGTVSATLLTRIVNPAVSAPMESRGLPATEARARPAGWSRRRRSADPVPR